MTKHLRTWITASAFCGLLLLTTRSHAETLTAGYFSYDSGLLADGNNSFDLANLTGGTLGAPNSIVTSELMSGSLSLDEGVLGTKVFNFVNIDLNGGLLAEIAPTVNVFSATLKVTLSESSGVSILDALGLPATVNLQGVTDTVLFASGLALTPCDKSGSPCDANQVLVDTAPVGTLVPEPGSLWLLATGAAGIGSLRFRTFKRNGPS